MMLMVMATVIWGAVVVVTVMHLIIVGRTIRSTANIDGGNVDACPVSLTTMLCADAAANNVDASGNAVGAAADSTGAGDDDVCTASDNTGAGDDVGAADNTDVMMLLLQLIKLAWCW